MNIVIVWFDLISIVFLKSKYKEIKYENKPKKHVYAFIYVHFTHADVKFIHSYAILNFIYMGAGSSENKA